MTVISEYMDDFTRARRQAANTAILLRRQLKAQVDRGERPAELLHWCALQTPATSVLSTVASSTLLRKGDVYRLHIIDWLTGSATRVKQRKTGSWVKLPPIRIQYTQQELGRCVVYGADLVSERTADRMRKRAWHEAGIRTHKRRKSVLHLVRHVYATWAPYRGYSMEEIGRELGHETEEATAAYIHDIDELFMEAP